MSTDDAKRMELETGQVLRIPDWFDRLHGREPANHGRPYKGPADYRIERVHSGDWRNAFLERYGLADTARAIMLLDEYYQVTTRLPIELRGLLCNARAQPYTLAQLAVNMRAPHVWVAAGTAQLVAQGALEVAEMDKQLSAGNRRKKQCETAWKREYSQRSETCAERAPTGARAAGVLRQDVRPSYSLSLSLKNKEIPHPPTPAPGGGGDSAGRDDGGGKGDEGTKGRRHEGTKARSDEGRAGRAPSRREQRRRQEAEEIAAANARVAAARQETAAQQRMVGP